MNRTKQVVTLVYACTAIAVGIWRHLQTGDSLQAIWFGLAMGLTAIVGAVLLFLKNKIPGYLLISVSLCFVAGWFLRRLLSGHPDGTSPRVILILVMCVIETAVLFLRPARKPTEAL